VLCAVCAVAAAALVTTACGTEFAPAGGDAAATAAACAFGAAAEWEGLRGVERGRGLGVGEL